MTTPEQAALAEVELETRTLAEANPAVENFRNIPEISGPLDDDTGDDEGDDD